MTDWQCGHFPFLPLMLAGQLISTLHFPQRNFIVGPAAAFGEAAGDFFGVCFAGVCFAGVCFAGVCFAGVCFAGVCFAGVCFAGVCVGFAAGLALPPGICMISLQCGHRPFLPAKDAGVVTSFPQDPQEKFIDSASLVASVLVAGGDFGDGGDGFDWAGDDCAGDDCAGDDCAGDDWAGDDWAGDDWAGDDWAGDDRAGDDRAGAEGDPGVAGICTIAAQWGHFPFRPAKESGVCTCSLHLGQGNSIVIQYTFLYGTPDVLAHAVTV
jgi:hypothetical protein